ncbi:hypothetical protein I6J04_11420 [Staphylococcus carnosus]|uniref:Lipoprotein n=1 Tax=Staphylococcus carnosus TaxID=1281 RepID=A0AAJ0JRH2_STACA|nr:hypothetical protein [Staphylococcus carnosus]KKB25972.1 hypothetical protein VV61_00350 [Staphylococcus carnosus]QQS84934.1 hypothetical protein I6J04_11420 [Staphylococcus carnosus]UTC00219.1 hypothetical protein A7E59_05475 [Staphylococcus carnosus]UTC02991.1 hypothetical protein A2I68_07310 [Staphylococcus carnosus]
MKKLIWLFLVSLIVLAGCGEKGKDHSQENQKPEIKKYSYHPIGTEEEVKDKAAKVRDEKRNGKFDSSKYYDDYEYGQIFQREAQPLMDTNSKVHQMVNNLKQNDDRIDEADTKEVKSEIDPALKELKQALDDRKNRDKEVPPQFKDMNENYFKSIEIFYNSFKDLENVIEHKKQFSKHELIEQTDVFKHNMDVSEKYFRYTTKLIEAARQSY